MSVSLTDVSPSELLCFDYEHSDRSKFVTHIVALYLANESSEVREVAGVMADEERFADLAWFTIRKFRNARRGSSTWRTACDLAVADFTNGRIRWNEVAHQLTSD